MAHNPWQAWQDLIAAHKAVHDHIVTAAEKIQQASEDSERAPWEWPTPRHDYK